MRRSPHFPVLSQLLSQPSASYVQLQPFAVVQRACGYPVGEAHSDCHACSLPRNLMRISIHSQLPLSVYGWPRCRMPRARYIGGTRYATVYEHGSATMPHILPGALNECATLAPRFCLVVTQCSCGGHSTACGVRHSLPTNSSSSTCPESLFAAYPLLRTFCDVAPGVGNCTTCMQLYCRHQQEAHLHLPICSCPVVLCSHDQEANLHAALLTLQPQPGASLHSAQLHFCRHNQGGHFGILPICMLQTCAFSAIVCILLISNRQQLPSATIGSQQTLLSPTASSGRNGRSNWEQQSGSSRN